MAASQRSALVTKTHSVLKKHYQSRQPPSGRPILEHLLYACCLENATYEAADKAFTRLLDTFFDWNEVRVSTVRDLASEMSSLPNPEEAAAHLRQVLQTVFETNYSFDLEGLTKLNLGKAISILQNFEGTTPFSTAYVIQTALGGHAIPIDRGALEALEIVGVVTQSEVSKGSVGGIERAVAKSKGAEFGSLVHQLGADYILNPYAPALHKIILQINPEAAERLPKRSAKRRDEADAEAESAKSAKSTKKKSASKDSAKKAVAGSKKPPSPGKAPKQTGSKAPKKSAAASKKGTAAKRKPR